MSPRGQYTRNLQQQPDRNDSLRQQQQSGSGEFQPRGRAGAAQQSGDGGYASSTGYGGLAPRKRHTEQDLGSRFEQQAPTSATRSQQVSDLEHPRKQERSHLERER